MPQPEKVCSTPRAGVWGGAWRAARQDWNVVWTEPPLRRVGFRDGTDEELVALHAVEAPIAAELGSNRMPQLVEAYMAFARALPSVFDDHAWIVDVPHGAPIAAAFCWSNSAGDERVMECDVLVRREHRRQGIGSRLLAAICDEAMSDGRSGLTWSTFDAAPGGDACSCRVGARREE